MRHNISEQFFYRYSNKEKILKESHILKMNALD